MSSLLDIGIAAVVIAYLLVKRMAGSPVRPGKLAVIPAVLVVIGTTDIMPSHHHHLPLTGGDVGFLVLAGAVSLVLGLLRGTSIRLSNRDGVPFQRYSPLTVVLWLVTIGVRIGLDLAGTSLGASGWIASASLLLMFGISLAGESLAVAGRLALRGELAALGAGPASRTAGDGYQGFDDRYTGRR